MIWRYRLILLAIILFFALVIARLFYWQAVRGQELSLLGKSQYAGVIKNLPERGEIKTSDGFPIATNKISYLLYANPKEIKDKKKISEILSSNLKIPQASVGSQLSLDKFWVPIKTGIDPQEKEKIEKLKIPGLGFEKRFERYYPEASLSSHLLGFVGKTEKGEDQGYFGLEGYYDRLLRGKEGIMVEIIDAMGKPILSKIDQDSVDIKGSTLILNIDRTIQFIVEEKLKGAVERYGASGGMVGVIEPSTGNILAISSFPSYEPSEYKEFDETLYKDPFVSSLYEPGSTFKPLIMSSALDLKLVTPSTKCPVCGGPISIGGYEIHTWNNKYHNDINIVDIIRYSDNVGMVYVAQKLGVDNMIKYLEKFGIGEPTGIDLQGEVSKPLAPKDLWYPVDLATKGFGQGVSITGVQLLDALSTIANKGLRMEPHVVSKVESPDGQVSKIPPKVLGRVISEETAKVMTEILVNAVEKGEASWTKLQGYRIAGKTGTASIPIKGHYDPHKTIASFIGFAPSENPKFALIVVLDKPTTSIYGSETAAPVFFEIARDLLLYYGISPKE